MNHENEILEKASYDDWKLDNNLEDDAQELSHDERRIFELTFKISEVKKKIDKALSYELEDLLNEYFNLRKELEAL